MNRSLTRVFPHTWRLVADNPSPLTGPGTNTYLVGREKVLIIDPGPDLLPHVENILAALETLGLATQAVLVTHPHPDHEGCAEALAHRLAVPLLRFGAALQDGDLIDLDCGQLVVYHTPGHIHAHISLWWPDRRLLFAADLVAGQGTILVIPPDGDMAAYLASLAAMQALQPAVILPGHGPMIDTPVELLQQYIDHRLAREQQVLDRLAQGLATPETIANAIYADQSPEVRRIAALQVEAHLQKLRQENRL
ncbi:MAG TPA: MBL fold metallo-hydrolase [Anaerolineae bacterium]|nr:MBL fold metallo-hydrolase [Anaerolineae bacterium]